MPKATILVVEDDANVLPLTWRVLTEAGYQAIPALTAEDAAYEFEQSGESIDVLLTDIVLPGKNGPRLYGELAKCKPALQVVYMTGYFPGELLIRGVTVRQPVLAKPFDLHELIGAIEHAIGSTPALRDATGREERSSSTIRSDALLRINDAEEYRRA